MNLNAYDKLITHKSKCIQCQKAKHFGEICQSGRIITRVIESQEESKKQ